MREGKMDFDSPTYFYAGAVCLDYYSYFDHRRTPPFRFSCGSGYGYSMGTQSMVSCSEPPVKFRSSRGFL